jgi:hypothetical protein
VQAAHHYGEQEHTVGKVVLTIDPLTEARPRF